MVICGIKLTHDGSIALIDGNKLVLSYEIEKLNNNERYSAFTLGLNEIYALLGSYANKIDMIVFDGWTPDQVVTIRLGDKDVPVKLAGYGSFAPRQNIMERKTFSLEGPMKLDYASYQHVAGHISSAYCSSPFAARGEDAYVLVWDGGMFPQLFYYNNKTNVVDSIGILFFIVGNIYGIFSQHFPPFDKTAKDLNSELSVPGKVMAYIAFGTLQEELLPIFEAAYNNIDKKDMNFALLFSKEVKEQAKKYNFSDQDILHTFHVFIENLLVEKLAELVKENGVKSSNICLAGGCALNIKWNSAVRDIAVFEEVWVPPFPNDSGSALGAACCEMIHATGNNFLDWNVYAGPAVIDDFAHEGWRRSEASIEDLARLLYEEHEPVVFINDRAEMGPRALGNRSILAPANDPGMKKVLNKIKGREDYRPVAPICLEEDAPEIFEPGIRDPYMLFDHLVKESWLDRVPAICHLDKTARLQTVGPNDNPTIYALLTAYKQLSGLPLLCNTSANHKGRGFFPNISSVIEWGEVNYIWSEGYLYEKINKIEFKELLSRRRQPSV
ncbi:carbamoyltransferase N-terminal domain-containing protein [Chitinophaga silvisoli]|uniref:Nodulation protein NodU n=1 Tax=Chitinophaga silvisoli TaxID=2291814 RepID=A0A3E1P013_9BACT|nr:carbamoyltransferase N-terminal domain-containing protein [Chitinophaga silvisoli]RFM33512.1 hypothetical protein DXN04_16250 [Chitinophaga silvisoli]